MMMPQELTCPHCGEPLETFPDPGGGEDQDYVEDCAVCCRPIRFRARYDEDAGEFGIELSAEP
jgi:hypothetical protein